MATKYCCCGSNLTAAKVLAALFIFIRIIQVGVASYALANYDFIRDFLTSNDLNQDELNDVIDQVELMLKIAVGLTAFFLAVDVGLLVGSIKKVKVLLVIWIIVSGFSIIYMAVSNVFLRAWLTIIGTVVQALIALWTMAAVYGAIKEIKEENMQ